MGKDTLYGTGTLSFRRLPVSSRLKPGQLERQRIKSPSDKG